jgi:translation initiation factor 1
MPFTFDGQYIPNTTAESGPKKPVKVRLLKRKNKIVTTIQNLPLSEKEMLDLSAKVKKQLGCGGAVKEGVIEIQGDKVDQVIKLLAQNGIKSS